jgi:hypothetical protein
MLRKSSSKGIRQSQSSAKHLPLIKQQSTQENPQDDVQAPVLPLKQVEPPKK